MWTDTIYFHACLPYSYHNHDAYTVCVYAFYLIPHQGIFTVCIGIALSAYQFFLIWKETEDRGENPWVTSRMTISSDHIHVIIFGRIAWFQINSQWLEAVALRTEESCTPNRPKPHDYTNIAKVIGLYPEIKLILLGIHWWSMRSTVEFKT